METPALNPEKLLEKIAGTQRDRLAAGAMNGLIIASGHQGYLRDPKALAAEAYKIADAMLEIGNPVISELSPQDVVAS